MFESLYSLPQQRAVTFEEFMAARADARRRSLAAYHEWASEWMPLDCGSVPAAIAHALSQPGIIEGHTQTGYKHFTASNSVCRLAKKQRGRLSTVHDSLPAITRPWVQEFEATVVALDQSVIYHKAEIFQRRFDAKKSGVIGSFPHVDDNTDRSWRSGQLHYFANVVDPALAVAEPDAVGRFGIMLADMTGQSHKVIESWGKVTDQMASRPEYKSKAINLFPGPWRPLTVNRGYIFPDAWPHYARTPGVAGTNLPAHGKFTTVNMAIRSNPIGLF